MLRPDRERLVGLLVRAERRLLELRETAGDRKRDRAMEVANLRLAIDMLGRAAQCLAAREVPPQLADAWGSKGAQTRRRQLENRFGGGAEPSADLSVAGRPS